MLSEQSPSAPPGDSPSSTLRMAAQRVMDDNEPKGRWANLRRLTLSNNLAASVRGRDYAKAKEEEQKSINRHISELEKQEELMKQSRDCLIQSDKHAALQYWDLFVGFLICYS